MLLETLIGIICIKWPREANNKDCFSIITKIKQNPLHFIFITKEKTRKMLVHLNNDVGRSHIIIFLY